MEPSDQALLKQYASRRDAEAFAQIVRRHAGVVYGACLRVAGNAHDAEDAAQECFLDLARHAGNVNTSLPGWLHTAATNHALMLLRKDTTREKHEERARAMPRGNPEPEWSEISPLVDEALGRMAEEDRVPLVLHFLQGKTQEQVAAELGVSQPTASRRIARGISLLRDQLKKSGVVASVAVIGTLLAQNAASAAPATLYVAMGKLALSGIGSAGKGALAASAGANAGAGGATAAAITGGGIVVKIAISTVIVAALVTGGIVVHKALSANPAPAPVPIAVPADAHAPVVAPAATPAPAPAAPVVSTLPPPTPTVSARPSPKSPEELAQALVAALSKGDLEAAWRLYPTREEFLKTFAGPEARQAYDSYFPQLEQGLEAAARQLQGAMFVGWDPKFTGNLKTVEVGRAFGPVKFAVATQALDNTHAVVRVNGQESDLKMDEMFLMDGAWRLMGELTLSPAGGSLAARMSEGIAGAGTIRVAMRVYAAAHAGEYPTFNDAKGDALGDLGIAAKDLTAKYFGPGDYSVTSTPVGYTVTAILGAETYAINQRGEEVGTFKTP